MSVVATRKAWIVLGSLFVAVAAVALLRPVFGDAVVPAAFLVYPAWLVWAAWEKAHEFGARAVVVVAALVILVAMVLITREAKLPSLPSPPLRIAMALSVGCLFHIIAWSVARSRSSAMRQVGSYVGIWFVLFFPPFAVLCLTPEDRRS